MRNRRRVPNRHHANARVVDGANRGLATTARPFDADFALLHAGFHRLFGRVFRGLRTVPVLVAIAQDMEALCPHALFINYSNPMNINMWAVSRSSPGVMNVGLCHSVQGTARQVFLRLVRLGRGTADTRRRLTLAEVTDLGTDAVTLSEVLTTFGRHRLLTFDHDAVTGQATVELARQSSAVA